MKIFLMILSITTGFTIIIGIALLIFTRNILNRNHLKKEQEKIKKAIANKLKSLTEQSGDVLSAMRRNVAELTGYYTINKQQARSAFISALCICFLGFILFVAGVIITYLSPDKRNIIAYSTVAGAIVEIIAGLFFWLYSEATKQINKFHDQLILTQQILTAIQIVNSISQNKRDDAYKIIVKELINIKTINDSERDIIKQSYRKRLKIRNNTNTREEESIPTSEAESNEINNTITFKQKVENYKSKIITECYNANNGDIDETSRILGVSQRQIYRYLAKTAE